MYVFVQKYLSTYFNSGRLRGRVKSQATGKVLSELETSQSELSIQWN